MEVGEKPYSGLNKPINQVCFNRIMFAGVSVIRCGVKYILQSELDFYLLI